MGDETGARDLAARVGALGRPARIVVAIVLLGVLGAGAAAVSPKAGEPAAVALEMAGDAATFSHVLAGAGPSISGASTRNPARLICPVPDTTGDRCLTAAHKGKQALARDYWFILSYVLSLAGLCLLGAWSRRRERRMWLYAAAWAAVLAGLLDVAENVSLSRALTPTASATWPRIATVAATAKWSLIPFVIVGALVGLHQLLTLPPRTADDGPALPKLDRERRWQPPAPGAWEFGTSGLCFSGGGIRSASFCLGVLQSMEVDDGHGPALAKFRYLTAVSGGGYIAGAAQLDANLEQHASPGAPAPYLPGSPEQDHVRRHGNYLADSAGEWLAAIAQAIGKLVANLLLAGLVVVALAQPLGWIGRLLLGAKPTSVSPRGNWPHFPLTLGVALALLAGPAIGIAAGRRHAALPAPGAAKNRANGFGLCLAIAMGAGAAVLATTAVLLPLLNGLGRQIAGVIGHPRGVAAATWPSILLTTVLGRVVTKALKRESAGGSAPADPTSPRAAAKQGKSKPRLLFVNNLAELLAGPVIALVALGYVCALASVGRANGPAGVLRRFGGWRVRDWQVELAVAAVALVVIFSVDAVNWSMHRFYKRRLWSAFTYDHTTHGERAWSTPTKLSDHATRLAGRPELVMCAAANVSGPELAPPGCRAVTWTFDHAWIGGPEIGWCPTTAMEDALAPHGRGGDISMFGAVAIAGAAFGSAMGRFSRGSLNSVFALANARLGVWLPNPAQLGADAWTYRRHSLTYLGREIFGRYSPDGRWVLVSDGGHYENLGVVELMRRRCTRIVCIEASGDTSGAVAAVADALRLAEEELGVTVHFRTPWSDAPGDGGLAGAPPTLVDALHDRLARNPVVHGEVVYPPEAGLADRTGEIIVARAVLDRETPFPVLSYAVGNTAFPSDSTADQWFDADQFDDYRLLGHEIGARVVAMMRERNW